MPASARIHVSSGPATAPGCAASPDRSRISLAVVRTWLKLRTLAARLCLDGQELIRRTPFVFVGNSEYEVEGTQLGRRRTMTDGHLSLVSRT